MRTILFFVLVAILVALSASAPLDAVTKAPINVQTQIERPALAHISVEELDEATEDAEESSDNDAEDEASAVSDGDDDADDDEDADEDADKDADEDAEPENSIAECQPLMCSRLYQPICVSVDGIPMTAPNDCHFQSKMHCAVKMARSLGEKAPVFHLLHEGRCRGNEPSALRDRRYRGPRHF